MQDKSSGAVKEIIDIQLKAYVTYCHCHSLVHAVKKTTKGSKPLSHTMFPTAEIAILLTFLIKRERMLDLIKHISL